MNKKLKYVLIIIGVLFFTTAVLIFRPVPIVKESNAIVESGVVKEIYSNKGNDIIFKLENRKRRFYINRGLENDLDLEDLKSKLIGSKVTFKYPKYWTPLDWNDEIKHLSKVEFNQEVIFNELK